MFQNAPMLRYLAPPDSRNDANSPQATMVGTENVIPHAAFDYVIVADDEGRIVDFNRAAEEIFGHSREQVVGRHMVDVVIPPAFSQGHGCDLRSYLQTVESDILGRRVELAATRADGSELPVELAVVRIPVSGRPLFVWFLRDITERRNRIAAQEAIHSILQVVFQPISLKELFEQALEILFSIPWLKLQSKGAVFLSAEEEGRRVLAMRAQRGLSDAHCSACTRVAFGSCLCGKAAVTGETVFTARVDEAHEIYYENMLPHGHYCVPILSKGEALGVLCLYVKEGHQRHAEEEIFLASVADAIAGAIKHVQTAESLRKSEERFDLAVRGTDAGIWDWNLQAGTVYFSARWKSMLGYDENEIGDQFREWESRLHPEDRERALSKVQEYLEGRVPEYELEHQLRHKDGSYRWILARGTAIRDGKGKAYRMAGSHIDITARKAAEERLLQNEIQLLAAQKIQELLLPTVPPSIDWLDIAGVSHPAIFAGGDYFDYLPMLGGAIGMVIGDVSGHGFAPALLMASTHAFLRCLAQTCATLGEILFRLNNFVTNETERHRFVTQLLVRFDLKKKSLTYVNAGHPTGYILDRFGRAKCELKSSSIPLGFVENQEYSTLEPLPLQPGDILVLLTDGILEATSPRGESFGSQRALDAVQKSREKAAPEIIKDLAGILSDFCGGAEIEDDWTALIVKVTR